MMLLVDIGNTRFKWRILRGEHLREGGTAPLAAGGAAPVTDAPWAGLECPDGVVVANVAGPEPVAALGEWVARHWGCPVQVVVPKGRACGVTNGYREPARLGADRWAALIGAYHRTLGAACVVDCGTAMTVDVIDPHGRHQGGVIIPGIGLMADALTAGTAGIDVGSRAFSPADRYLGLDTDECIAVGAAEAAVGLIERVQGKLRRAWGEAPPCLITGGGAPSLTARLESEHQWVPDLVFEGLARLSVSTGND